MKTIENNKSEEGLYRQVGSNDLVTELTAKVKSSKALTSQDVMDWEAGSVHIGKQAPNESIWKDANTPSPSPVKDSRLAPLKTTPSSSSHEEVLSAANALLEQSGGGGTSPVVETYMKVEKMGAEQSSAATIEKLLARVKYTEKALARATETVESLNSQVATLAARDHLNEMAKKDEEASWVMESMELKIQLKEVENSEKQARNALTESKKEVQVLKAEVRLRVGIRAGLQRALH